jgi:spore maturation protein CgeB
MRVFFASHRSPNTTALPGSQIWYLNLHLSLQAMGVEVVQPTFDVGDQHLSCVYGRDALESRARYSALLLQDLRAAHEHGGIDLFLSYYYSASIDPGAVDAIRGLGIPALNFYCNAVHQFDLIAEIAPHFDYCMVPESEALPKYEAVGARPIHIQMAANPAVYRPHNLLPVYDVTFIGQKYLNREAYMAHLHHHGIRCDAWGPGWVDNADVGARKWSRQLKQLGRRALDLVGEMSNPSARIDQLPPSHRHPPVDDEELVRMYSRSRISMGFSEVQMPDGSLRRHIRLRDFEAPMSGALYFTGYQAELAEYYEIDKDIVCYDSQDELLDKVRYYLSHDAAGEQVRMAGLRRARRDHTWENRFRQLFKTIGLSGKL